MNCFRYNLKEEMTQETGTPALLCFKSEEQPADCRITSIIILCIYLSVFKPFERTSFEINIHEKYISNPYNIQEIK